MFALRVGAVQEEPNGFHVLAQAQQGIHGLDLGLAAVATRMSPPNTAMMTAARLATLVAEITRGCRRLHLPRRSTTEGSGVCFSGKWSR
jgi:hypothetical protein